MPIIAFDTTVVLPPSPSVRGLLLFTADVLSVLFVLVVLISGGVQ